MLRRSVSWLLAAGWLVGCSVPTLSVADGGDAADRVSVDATGMDAEDLEVGPADGGDTTQAADAVGDAPADTGCPDAACGCADLATDPANCGQCGHACAMPANTTPLCVAGMCDSRCAGTFGDCDRNLGNGCEVDLATANTDCGVCGRTCGGTGPANTVPACLSGTCGFACATGFGDCDANSANGCETPLNTLTHCGACGTACASVANSVATCTMAGCGFTCDFGFGNCDRDPTNGCETDLTADDINCGACRHPCIGTTSVCCNGRCQSPALMCSPL